MVKILNFGSLNIDYVYSLDHFVNAGETASSNNLSIFCGGKGLNQSIALKKAGANVYHAGCIGKTGDVLLNLLKDEGINTSNVKKVDTNNGHAVIQVDKSGENCIILFEGSNGEVTEIQIDETLSNFQKGDFIVLQNEINNIDIIMKKAYEKNLTIVLNPSPINEKIFKLPLEYVDYFVLNKIEAKNILKSDNDNILDNFSKKYPNAHIILTLGEKGVIYKYKDQKIKHDSYKTNVIDTTGAGDTFLGFFITLISNGETTEYALETASKASSIAISQKGASNSIPSISEVLKTKF